MKAVYYYLSDLLGEEGIKNLSDLAEDVSTGDLSVLPTIRSVLDDMLPNELFVSEEDGAVYSWLAVDEVPHLRLDRKDMARILMGDEVAEYIPR